MKGRTMRWIARQLGVACTLSVAALVCSASTALANAPCGIDNTMGDACPVNTASQTVFNGSINAAGEADWYVFYATAGTQLNLSITDNEDPSCSTGDTGAFCGNVFVWLDNPQGLTFAQTENDSPDEGAPFATTFSYTFTASGTYYFEVQGGLGTDANNNPTPVPYTMSMTASPNLTWPAPASGSPGSGSGPGGGAPPSHPACVVPRLAAKTRLALAEQRIVAAHCVVGPVHRVKSRQPSGTVVKLSPGAGTSHPFDTPITLEVSAG